MYSCQSKPAEGRDVNEGGPDGVQLLLWALHNPPSYWLTDWQLHIPPHPQLSPLISLPRFCLILGHGIRHWREFLSFQFLFRIVQKKKTKKALPDIWKTIKEGNVYSESKSNKFPTQTKICDQELKAKQSLLQAMSVSFPLLNIILSFPL